MNIGNAAMLASIIASLVAVPAASGTIAGDYNAAVGKMVAASQDNASSVPRQVTEEVSSDSLTKTVETAFGTASFTVSSGTFDAELSTPEATVSMTKTPTEKKRKIEKGDLSLTIVSGAGEQSSDCETSSGILETSFENGKTSSTFTGRDRASVEEQCDTARTEMEEELETLAKIAADADLMERTVAIVEVDSETEGITLENTGAIETSLDGWTISDEVDNTFTFDEISIQPGEQVTVKSGDAADDCDSDLCWSSSNIWNTDGDTATLTKPDGTVMDTFSYGD